MLLRTTIADYREPAVESIAINKELRQTIDRILCELSSRDRRVIMLMYGLHDGYFYTLEETGRIVRCSREKTRGIQRKVLGRLSVPRRAATLLEFIDTGSATIDLNALPYAILL